MKRDFLTFNDLEAPEVLALFHNAAGMKANRKIGKRGGSLARFTVGMLFDKPSTRTRVSFEAGVNELGGAVVFLHRSETQMSRAEPVSHSARVLSRYLDALVIRTFDQTEIEEWAKHASIPVINALTDEYHPCQVLGDLFTIWERKGSLDNLKAAWIGDGNNMAQSWIVAAARLGFQLHIATPAGREPSEQVLQQALQQSNKIEVGHDPVAAVKGAAVINTDTWESMGQESPESQGSNGGGRALFEPYQVNQQLLSQAAADAIVLHCLPAHRGDEITDEVMDGPTSRVWEQAGNRLHVQKAILKEYLK